MNPAALTLKLDRARDYLFARLPFYGTLSMRLRDILTTDAGPTACTDGREIRWNPAFLAALTDEETRWVLAHETLHCAHGHLWRIRCDETGNLAADYEIADTLDGIPGLTPPAGIAALPGIYPGKACEEIDAILRANPPPPPPRPAPGGFTKPGDDGPATGPPSSAPGAPAPPDLRTQWETAVTSAALTAAAGCGTLPGDLARLAADRRRVRIDWRTELAEFLRSAVPVRTDYTRSARRMATAPAIYPRRITDRLDTIAVIRDTSGSICGPILAAFNDCIATLTAATGAPLLLIDADSDICAIHEIPAGTPFPETASGGGGTDFRPAIAEITRRIESGETIAGIIYLTDLIGPQPTDIPAETIWLCTTTRTAKTGRTIRIEPETIAA